MHRGTHNRGRSLKSHHKRTSGGLKRKAPSRARRFPSKRS